MKRVIVVIVITLVLVFNLFADESKQSDDESLKVYKLKGSVISATKSKVSQLEIPISTSIIYEEQIVRSSATKVMDLLQDEAGVFTQKSSPFGRADISLRGLGNNGRKIMVLVDSRPIKMGLFGCSITHSLPLDNVKKVELVRGPSSVLYGSDALGGVINILTDDIKDNSFATTLSYGSFNTRKLLLNGALNLGGFYFNSYASREESDGYRANNRVHTYATDDLNVKFGGKLTPALSFYASGKYFDGYKEDPLMLADDTASWAQYYRSAFDLTTSYVVSEHLGTDIKVYTNRGNHLFSDDAHYNDISYGSELKVDADILNNLNLLSGIDYRYQSGKQLTANISITAGEWAKYEYGIYGLAKYDFSKMFRLVTGLRYNMDENTGGIVIPQVGVLANVTPNTRVRSNISKGFKSPQLNELYLLPPANPDLEAEDVWNYEVGVNQMLNSNLLVDLSVYKMEGKNLIEVVVEPQATPPPLVEFRNTGKINFWGAEGRINYNLSNRLDVTFNYSFLDPGSHTTYRPKNQFSLNTEVYPLSNLAFNIRQKYVSGLYAADDYNNQLPEYYLLDLVLKYSLFDFINISLIANNILDREYSMHEDFPMPGRNFTGKINLNVSQSLLTK